MPSPHLVVDDLRIRLGEKPVVESVSFEARAGAMTCLLGRNGSGKTTVLRALAGLIPYQGRASLDGAEIRGIERRPRARQIAYVPQQSLLAAGMTTRNVVAQGRFAHTGRSVAEAGDPVIEEAMRRVDVTSLADRRFPTLSLGEQRRVLLGRALATGAPCVLLDEPDAYLDVGQRVRLFCLLRELRAEGRALVVVVHALTQARDHADECVVIDGGRVVARGGPREALDASTLRDVFGVDTVEGAAPRYILPGVAT